MGPRADARGTAVRRRRLLADASGAVVEVGAGTGLNLRHYPPAVRDVLAIEPDPSMFRRLAASLPQASVPVRLSRAGVEAIPTDDASIDAVVFSFVLCTVEDQAAALAAARRVLRSDGRLLLFEHVRAAEPRLSRWQDRLERPWGLVAGGCHPNRDTVAAVEAAGFRIEALEAFDEPGAMLARPHVLGTAVPA